MSVYTTLNGGVAPSAIGQCKLSNISFLSTTHCIKILITDTYQGCYTDGEGPGNGDGNPRLLSTRIYKGATGYEYVGNSVEKCITACNTYGFAIAGNKR
jgi:hypothetical protein